MKGQTNNLTLSRLNLCIISFSLYSVPVIQYIPTNGMILNLYSRRQPKRNARKKHNTSNEKK